MSYPAGIPAAWYPDPSGRHQFRYWQGQSWTDAVADGGRTSSDPLPPVVPDAGTTDAQLAQTPAPEAPTVEPAPVEPVAAATTPDEPALMGPEPAEPVIAEPVAAEPVAAEPVAAKPVAAEPAEPGAATVVLGGAPVTTVVLDAGPPPAWMPPAEPAHPGPPPDPAQQQPGVGAQPGPFVRPFTGPQPVMPPGFVPPAPAGRRRRIWWIAPVAAVVVLLLVAVGVLWYVVARPGPGPERLAASSVTSRSVALTWSRPRTGKAPEQYVVRRNGTEVARTGTDATFQDTGLEPLTEYRYTVLAVVGGKKSSATDELKVHTHPANPTGVDSGEITPTSVVITWGAPPGPAPDNYVVQRDGVDVATVAGGTLTYMDSGLTPSTDVTYSVIALTKGERSDTAPLMHVTTKDPPVADARFQGAWNVTLKVTKNHGTKASVGDTDSAKWTFTPRCGSGACVVDLSGTLGSASFTMTLNRAGTLYRGQTQAKIAKCDSVLPTDTIAISLNVTAGGMSAGTWAVSNWTGSLTLSMPYVRSGNYYCPTQSADFSVTPDDVSAPPST
jgi:hypothetical protein